MRLLYAYFLTAMISLVGPAVSQDIVLGLSKQEIGILRSLMALKS